MVFFNDFACPIGLDISDLSVKFVQLKKTGNKIKIRAFGKIGLKPGLLENGEIKDKKELAKAIRKLISRPDFGKTSSKEAVICLSENKTFLKIIEIDKEIADKKKAIEEELLKHVPLPIGELIYDWQIIGDSGRSNLVLVGAAPQKIVDEQLDLLREARLLAVAVETEPLSACRCLLKEENPKYKEKGKTNYAIIDIGATDASLTVYSKNSVLFSVSLPVSGEKITAQIAQAAGTDHEQAEKIKILYGLNEGGDRPEVKNIIAAMINDLAEKIKEAIGFFHHHFPAWGPIEKMLICGGGANIKNLDGIIGKKTGIETSRGDIFTNLKGLKNDSFAGFSRPLSPDAGSAPKKKKIKEKSAAGKKAKISHDIGLSYATAIGLALRGIFIDE